MKPNFFIVGAPKCGTTAWVEYLRSHPGIFISHAKEPHHFSRDFPKWNFVPRLEDYLALFQDSGDAQAVGEGSVRYLYSKAAAREIHAFNPDARILIFLRDQQDFLPSLHHQQLYNGDENMEDFEKAWRLSGQRPACTIASGCREPSFLDYAAMGRFYEQVERYFAVFQPKQIRLIAFQDWVGDPRKTYCEILEFLGLEDDGRSSFPRINEAKYHKSKLMASLTQIPPAWVRKSSAMLTQLTGKQLGILARLREINRGSGYRTSVTPELKEEIRRYYEADNARLLARFGVSLGRAAGAVQSAA